MDYNFFEELAKMVEKINFDDRALTLPQLVTCQLATLLPSVVYTVAFYSKMAFPYETYGFDMYTGVFDKKAFYRETEKQLKQRGFNRCMYLDTYEQLSAIHIVINYKQK